MLLDEIIDGRRHHRRELFARSRWLKLISIAPNRMITSTHRTNDTSHQCSREPTVDPDDYDLPTAA
jgi:hypothetical protein